MIPSMRPASPPAVFALAILGPVLAFAGPARAQEAADRVHAEARVRGGAPIPSGGEGVLEVTLTMDPGWHIYGPGDSYEDQRTTFAVLSGAEGLLVGPFEPTKPPKAHKYEFDDGPRMEYEGSVTYAASVRVPAGTAPGKRTVQGAATVNTCDDKGCLPTGDVPFEVVLEIGGVAAGPPVAPAPPPNPAAVGAAKPIPPPQGTEAKPGDGGMFAFLLTAVIAGILTVLTPCVFPMIPLTVSLLTKRAEKDPGRVVPNAVAYGAGMFVSLAGIGLALSLLFGVAPSDFALSPWFNVAIFLFLGYLALSLLGAYDITLPAFLTDWAQGKSGAGGGAGLFFMGMTLAFTSFACAAPFAGVLVVQARTDLGKGVLGMSVYAGTFTLPFFVMALFPGLLRGLPRSGGWLNAVKVVMGFVEVAAAFKFLRAADTVWHWDVFSFEFVLAIWIACALGAFLYLLGFVVLPHDTRLESVGVGRLLWALLFLACGVFLVPGLFGRDLPAYVQGFIIRDADERDWILNDLDYALHEAKERGKPVFVDFTGFG